MMSPFAATLGSRLADAKNRPSGFDYMRLVLAVLVVASHTINVCYGHAFTLAVWSGPARAPLALILPMFFALSGFLVAGSFERCRTIVSFCGLRVLRLLPALAVDTLIAALLIGPYFTTLPLHQYFTDPQFRAYFLNMLGDVHYALPGMFASNPWPDAINQQLWTLPFELACYVALTIASYAGMAQRPHLLLGASIAANVVLVVHGLRPGSVAVTVHGPMLVLCFFYGVCAYQFRDRIVWSARLCVLSGVVALICLSVHGGDYFAALPATYLTVFLGLTQPRRHRFVASGDYSYGIFLYGFPIQQTVAAMLGPAALTWYVHFPISLALTLLFAMMSWHGVEKRALKLRGLLNRIEDGALRIAAAVPGGRYLVPALAVRIAKSPTFE
ncbi:acyltransferase [Paraburkholderia sp. MMS20-SJTN17]|uniref:Acyltransferase n=1 Tax=Paraburkholderia translucens TaxID=2886945 RepID=A0ABS8K958_9BURK|nr:acyltransferase [Paraburkholderia sp. MMS20-SJTN17]MCC8401287.1 acyltransferase [Paraburkholderia sp. MMS20-SJTN17]